MKRQQQMIIMGSIIGVAIIAAIALILLSGNASTSELDYSAIPQERLEDGGFVLGDPDAPVTIVEFADFACPHCQTYKTDVVEPFVREYVVTGQARFEYRSFPTVGGALTNFATQIAECAEEMQPGAFWQAHELFYVYARTGRFTEDMGRMIADELGLDYGELLSCTSDADQAQVDQALGQRLGVSGTPAVMVRYGDSEPTWINVGGQTYNRGGVSYEIIQQVVQQAQ